MNLHINTALLAYNSSLHFLHIGPVTNTYDNNNNLPGDPCLAGFLSIFYPHLLRYGTVEFNVSLDTL